MEKTIGQLVAQLQSGDQTAWDELYTRTRKSAYAAARSLCRTEQDTEDVVQEAYAKAYLRLNSLKEPERFVPWLCRIVADSARDHLRRRRPMPFSDLQREEAPDPDWVDDRVALSPEVMLEEGETMRLMAGILDTLPEEQRICMLLFYGEEMRISEIAEALGVSENTVKNRLNYARNKVRTELLRLEEEEGVKLYGLSPAAVLTLALRRQISRVKLPASLEALPAPRADEGAGKARADRAAPAKAVPGEAAGTAAAGTAGAATAGFPIRAAAVAAVLLAVGGCAVAMGIRQSGFPAASVQVSAQSASAQALQQDWGDVNGKNTPETDPALYGLARAEDSSEQMQSGIRKIVLHSEKSPSMDTVMEYDGSGRLTRILSAGLSIRVYFDEDGNAQVGFDPDEIEEYVAYYDRAHRAGEVPFSGQEPQNIQIDRYGDGSIRKLSLLAAGSFTFEFNESGLPTYVAAARMEDNGVLITYPDGEEPYPVSAAAQWVQWHLSDRFPETVLDQQPPEIQILRDDGAK